MIVNLFSGAEVVICSTRPGYLQNPFVKIIFSQVPTSSSCIIAAISPDWLSIALCKVGCDNMWITKGWRKQIFRDIAFCNGDLYGLLHRSKELVKFGISMKEDGIPMVTSTHHLSVQRFPGCSLHFDSAYILELHGQLLMAVRSRWLPNCEWFFKVFGLFHAVIGEPYQYKWEEVTDFGDHALFLGPTSSMAVHVPVGAERRGLERNHIYYLSPSSSMEIRLRGNEVYSVISSSGDRMYCREDPTVGDGVKRTGYFVLGRNNTATWTYPQAF
ncbi:hypothetical protein ZWY2020_007897 [Hordeum vulgare]|nr:hypothetical protein ZWY2020_007897 [Hordeum vulgare]